MSLLFGFFVSEASAYKVIRNMLIRKEIKYEKLVRQGNGRPYRAFSNWNVPDDQWKHELDLTDICKLYPVNFLRGGEVNENYKSDAEAEFQGELHYFEMDESTERGEKLEQRLHAYDYVRNPVLWITHREDRRRNMIDKCSNENCYFGLFKEIIDDPYGPVWVNKRGERASITS